MWKIILLVAIFDDGGKLMQVSEPRSGTRFETVDVCEQVWTKISAEVSLPAGITVKHWCVGP